MSKQGPPLLGSHLPDHPYGATVMIIIAALYAPGSFTERALLIVAVTPVLAVMMRSARP